MQVEQVKTGHFEAIYEDNVWKLKPTSNDQIWNFVVEFLFLIPSGHLYKKVVPVFFDLSKFQLQLVLETIKWTTIWH